LKKKVTRKQGKEYMVLENNM